MKAFVSPKGETILPSLILMLIAILLLMAATHKLVIQAEEAELKQAQSQFEDRMITVPDHSIPLPTGVSWSTETTTVIGGDSVTPVTRVQFR